MDILLTGATGFVASHLYPALVERGHSVTCTSRDPAKAARRWPGRSWAHLDLADSRSLRAALRGRDAAFYLVHGMGSGPDYPRHEAEAARTFVEAAEAANLERVIYLGGMAPSGPPSRHLASRLNTGAILRRSRIPTFELRASMIVGAGSASFRVCRDLAVRLPVMILPRWLRSRTEPIAIADVVTALVAALDLHPSLAGDHDLPGPEVMTIRNIIDRTARLAGTRPLMIDVPFVTPHLSTYWIRWVTRSEVALASELVEGLRSDILARDDAYWHLVPGHDRIGFDEAARRALRDERATVSRLGHAVERAARRAARKAPA